MRNPTWTRDELILALDLYFRQNPLHMSETHPEVVALSKVLHELPIHGNRPDAVRFRNPAGVYMKLCNFLRLDPTYKGIGLQAGSRLDEEVWREFASNRQRLAAVAEAIRAADGVCAPGAVADDETSFPEGRVLARLHGTFERNASLIKAKKRLALKCTGRLACEVCGFDFRDFYGAVGEGYIEFHHTVPVSQLRSNLKTRLEDLAMVCANCHRMLHLGGELMRLEDLRNVAAAKTAAVSVQPVDSAGSKS